MNSKDLAIPKESVLHMFTLLFSFIMFLTFIVYVQYANGKMGAAVTTPAFGQDLIYVFFSFLGITVPVLLFLFTICFAKKNLKMLLIPIAITPVSYVLFELFSIFKGDSFFILRQWYKVASSFLVLFLFYFTVNKPKITSKIPIVVGSIGMILISIILTLAKIGPFVETIPSFIANDQYFEKTTIIYMSALLQYISYQASILFLCLPLTPGGRYSQKESRKLFLIKHMDKIQEITNAHRH